MDAIQARPAKHRNLAKFILRKALTLALVTLVFGWLYSWASPWAFPTNRVAGFGYGLLHGAMMPISLPSLVVGRDVPIYDDNNSGRIYKIGYICGVNICGLIFIGPLFYRPRNLTSTNSGKSQ
ncbi:MAG TPA: hypothetical protein VFF11_07130 [Candidatus Binatia bacterium]|nr:hypothetical protein [Candidatus Binatia bacterium]